MSEPDDHDFPQAPVDLRTPADFVYMLKPAFG
jgi:hypothetical protein